MAGAVSAGAYTAGVIDFLFQALDHWYSPELQRALVHPYQAADGNGPLPLHEVRLKVMAGASAGGMCAALSAVSAVEGTTHKFHKAWVEDIDIRHLLDPADLKRRARADPKFGFQSLQNLLNCDVLDVIARDALTRPTRFRWPPWLPGQHLDFYLTLTNLNGLTYAVTQQGGNDQLFTDHADRLQFRLLAPHHPPLAPAAVAPDLVLLPSTNGAASTAAWDRLGQAALSTGAFPIALVSRAMKFPNAHFASRWYLGRARPDFVRRVAAPPDDPQQPDGARYLFVDGGVTNNEPFEIARRVLAGDLSGRLRNDPNGQRARRALVLIDPFPGAAEPSFAVLQQELGPLVGRLLATLLNQARFRAEDLVGALDLDVNSRFVVAPVREGTRPPAPALACGPLGAFGGFLSRKFRQHDFELGRRNCQRFLRRWFTLPADNGLFERWTDALKQHPDYVVRGTQGEARLPIIPLLGASAAEVPAPRWADARLRPAELQEVENQLEERLKVITELLGRSMPPGWWAARAVYPLFVRGKLRRMAQESVMKIIRDALRGAELL
ncbi:patatin-like phospholipase family protein [Hymenobacter coalescens]